MSPEEWAVKFRLQLISNAEMLEELNDEMYDEIGWYFVQSSAFGDSIEKFIDGVHESIDIDL